MGEINIPLYLPTVIIWRILGAVGVGMGSLPSGFTRGNDFIFDVTFGGCFLSEVYRSLSTHNPPSPLKKFGEEPNVYTGYNLTGFLKYVIRKRPLISRSQQVSTP